MGKYAKRFLVDWSMNRKILIEADSKEQAEKKVTDGRYNANDIKETSTVFGETKPL